MPPTGGTGPRSEAKLSLVAEAGFEPAHFVVMIHAPLPLGHSTTRYQNQQKQSPAPGVEPRPPGIRPGLLPLQHARDQNHKARLRPANMEARA